MATASVPRRAHWRYLYLCVMGIARRGKARKPLKPLKRPPELDRYQGKWVAVIGQRVVASGATTRALERELERLGNEADEAVVLKVSRPKRAVTVGMG
jgi:hypothetical protein